MILGIGVDMVQIPRIEGVWRRHGPRFVARILTPLEQQQWRGKTEGAALRFLATRFAAKEACVKALGTGFSQGISFQDIEITNQASGAPVLSLRGKAEAVLTTKAPLGKVQLHLSLSDDAPGVVAFVVISLTD